MCVHGTVTFECMCSCRDNGNGCLHRDEEGQSVAKCDFSDAEKLPLLDGNLGFHYEEGPPRFYVHQLPEFVLRCELFNDNLPEDDEGNFHGTENVDFDISIEGLCETCYKRQLDELDGQVNNELQSYIQVDEYGDTFRVPLDHHYQTIFDWREKARFWMELGEHYARCSTWNVDPDA